MLKRHGLSPLPTFAAFELPPKPNKITDYAFGAETIGDDEGLRNKTWTFIYGSAEIKLLGTEGESETLVSGITASEVSGCFDSGMLPVVVWVSSGITRLRFFNENTNDYTILELGSGFITPKVTFDQRNHKYESRRVYLTYIRGNGLFIRTSDDNFQSEKTLAFFEKDYQIEQFGLSLVNRLQYRLFRLVMPEDLLEGDEDIIWTTFLLDAVYDPLTQTITCYGEEGDIFETYSSADVLIGSGVIPSSGTITYPINEEDLFDGEQLETSVINKGDESFYHIYSKVEMPFVAIVNPLGDSSQGEGVSFDIQSQHEVNFNYTIDWGDGTIESGVTEDGFAALFHNYADGTYTVTLTVDKVIEFFNIYNVKEIVSWGTRPFTAIQIDSPIINKVPDYLPTFVRYLDYTFANCTAFNYNINGWDVSRILSMNSTFRGCENFNQPLNNWDVSSVGQMPNMFRNAYVFNQDLSMWCVTNITEEPSNFALNSPLEPQYYPVWGTCPNEETPSLGLDYGFMPAELSYPEEYTGIKMVDQELIDATNLTRSFDPANNLLDISMSTDLNYPLPMENFFGVPPTYHPGAWLIFKDHVFQDLMTRYNAGSTTTALKFYMEGTLMMEFSPTMLMEQVINKTTDTEAYGPLVDLWPLRHNFATQVFQTPVLYWEWVNEAGELLVAINIRNINNIDFFKLQNSYQTTVQNKEILFDVNFDINASNGFKPSYVVSSNPYTNAIIRWNDPFQPVYFNDDYNETQLSETYHLIDGTNRLTIEHNSDMSASHGDRVIQFWIDNPPSDVNIISGQTFEKKVYTNGIMFTIFIPEYSDGSSEECAHTELPMLDMVIPDIEEGTYVYSYRVNGGPIITHSENAGGNVAQLVIVNILGYYGLFDSLVWRSGQSQPKAFAAQYDKPIRGVGLNNPYISSIESNTIEFLLTPLGPNEYDLIQTVFGGSVTIHSCGTVDFNTDNLA